MMCAICNVACNGPIRVADMEPVKTDIANLKAALLAQPGSKPSYATYIKDRLHGFGGGAARCPATG